MMECRVVNLTRAGITASALLALCVSMATSTVAPAETPLVVPIEGEPFKGALVAAGPDGSLAFQTEDGRREVSAGNLVRWGALAEPDRPPLLLLHDGTLLVAGILEVTESQLALDSDTLGLVRLPREQLVGMVLQLPARNVDRDRLLDDAVDNDEETTRVVMLNGDQMRGELIELDDRTILLRTAVGPVKLEFERVSTLGFPFPDQAREPVPGKSTFVGLADGSRVVAKEFVIDAPKAVLTTVGGLSWKTESKAIVFLQPASTRVVYLSDLTPTGYRHVPFLDRTWRFRTDRNVLGGLMRCGGRIHLKGLGMHTAARISYVSPEGSRLFQASVGIDDATEGQGSVRFRVFVEGDQKYVSPTVRGHERAIPISVDVKSAQRVDLVVDFADRADVQDQANWLDARFVIGD
jgi:hypothetical protein